MGREVTCPYCGYQFKPRLRPAWPGDYFEMCGFCARWLDTPPPGRELAAGQNGWCTEHQEGRAHTGCCPTFRPHQRFLRPRATGKRA